MRKKYQGNDSILPNWWLHKMRLFVVSKQWIIGMIQENLINKHDI